MGWENYEYKIKNDNIILNKPIASTKENPKIVKENNEDLKEGFLAVPLIKAANTKPIPNPAPVKPDDANPAPINFADSRILLLYILLYYIILYSIILFLLIFNFN